MKENEFIETLLKKNRDALAEIPKKWAQAKRTLEREIDDLISSAGIMDEVQRLRDQLESTQKALQSQADKLQGQNLVLETLHKKYHLAPIPDGVTHMYGIELAPLDPETRLRVMHGQAEPSWAETIQILGGDPERPDWDGTEEEEWEEDSVDEYEEDDLEEDDLEDLRRALAEHPEMSHRELAQKWLQAREELSEGSED